MEKSLDFHPNGMIFKAIFENDEVLERDYYSVGGGFVATKEDNSIKENCIRTLYPCHKGEDVIKYCEKLDIKRFSDLIYINEEAWQTKKKRKALYIWQQIKECIYKGISKEGILPGGLNVSRRAANFNKKLLGKWFLPMPNIGLKTVKNSKIDLQKLPVGFLVLHLAVNEENASFGRIITAPTMVQWCNSCGFDVFSGFYRV
jgi:L-serine dehydratase